MKVKDVMTARSLKYCSPETNLQNAAKKMKESNCGALPVVDREKKVLGIITDRDICLSLAQKHSTVPDKITVSQIMPSKVHTVKSTDDIAIAYRQMRTNQVGRLPVVDDEGKLKGILSLHHIINKAVGHDGKGLGTVSSPEENLMKTIQAITNRYNGKSESKTPKRESIKKEHVEAVIW
jgi:CBS domain-containing protein